MWATEQTSGWCWEKLLPGKAANVPVCPGGQVGNLELDTRAALSSAGQGNCVPTYLLLLFVKWLSKLIYLSWGWRSEGGFAKGHSCTLSPSWKGSLQRGERKSLVLGRGWVSKLVFFLQGYEFSKKKIFSEGLFFSLFIFWDGVGEDEGEKPHLVWMK